MEERITVSDSLGSIGGGCFAASFLTSAAWNHKIDRQDLTIPNDHKLDLQVSIRRFSYIPSRLGLGNIGKNRLVGFLGLRSQGSSGMILNDLASTKSQDAQAQRDDQILRTVQNNGSSEADSLIRSNRSQNGLISIYRAPSSPLSGGGSAMQPHGGGSYSPAQMGAMTIDSSHVPDPINSNMNNSAITASLTANFVINAHMSVHGNDVQSSPISASQSITVTGKGQVPVVTPVASMSGDIRPMTMGSRESVPKSSIPSFQSKTIGSGSASITSGSGSGGAPIISSITGGLQLNNTQAPNYTITNGVPVGTLMSIVIAPPPSLTFQTIAWTGGTNVSAYLSVSYNDPPPQTMSPTMNVVTNQSTFSFVVDATARTYNVSVSVTYTSGGNGSASLKFTSIRPTIATLTKGKDNPIPMLLPNSAGTLAYEDPNNSVGMPIVPTVTTAPNWGGQFMIMQTANLIRSNVDQNGNTFTMTNQGGGPNIDNGPPAFPQPIGMLITASDANNQLQYGWIQEAGTPNNTVADEADDAVIVPAQNPATDQSVTVGTPGSNPVPETFVSYLMYRPPATVSQSVWVALAQLSWGWGGSITNTNGKWSLNNSATQNPAATPLQTVPSTNNACFPSWTAATSQLSWVKQ
jgi:hypothetical protein